MSNSNDTRPGGSLGEAGPERYGRGLLTEGGGGGGVLSQIVDGGSASPHGVLHSCICTNTRCRVANLHTKICTAAWLICIFAKIRTWPYG